MRVLMIVQLVDEQDWLRGFIVPWIRSLAAQVDHLHVLTLEKGQAALPDNVTMYSMGKELGRDRLRELAAFHQTMSRIGPEVDIFFSHMTPRYTWLAAPYAALFRKPQVLWFVHRQVSWELRLAHHAAARIVTASPESFRLQSSKVTVLGHGIDLTHFYPASEQAPGPVVLSVGRLSPIKNHEILIQAIAHLRDQGCNLKVSIAGGETPENPGYAKHLQDLVRSLKLENQVRLLGAIPYQDIPALYREAALTVNLCPTGGMDKAVLESMACGVPALVRNKTFLPLLESYESALWCQHLDPQRVAAQLQGFLSQPPHWRAEVAAQLRQRIQADYSLDVLTERLVGLFSELSS